MGLADWTRLFVIALVWGSAFFVIEIALRDTGPLTLVLGRLVTGALALAAFCVLTGKSAPLTPRMIGGFAFLGLFGNTIPFSLIALGQTQINSSLTAILIATTPLFTVLTGHLWNRAEPATVPKFLGVVTGFLGVMVLMGADALTTLGSGTLGQICVLGAAFSYAISAVFGRRFRAVPPAVTAAGMVVCSCLMMVPLVLVFESPIVASPPSLLALACMAALGVFSTALAYILYFTNLANAGATNAMLVTIVQPPLAILLGIAFLNEVLSPNQLMGLLLILVGLILVDGRLFRTMVAKYR